MCTLPVSSVVLKLLFCPRWDGQPSNGQLTASGHSLTSPSHHWWRLQKAWEKQESVLDAKESLLLCPLCAIGLHGLLTLVRFMHLWFWVALGFRFRENCLDMITHQTGTVLFWVKAMRDRRLWLWPGTFLCLFVLFQLFLKILPLSLCEQYLCFTSESCPLQYENKIDTRSRFWEHTVKKGKKR